MQLAKRIAPPFLLLLSMVSLMILLIMGSSSAENRFDQTDQTDQADQIPTRPAVQLALATATLRQGEATYAWIKPLQALVDPYQRENWLASAGQYLATIHYQTGSDTSIRASPADQPNQPNQPRGLSFHGIPATLNTATLNTATLDAATLDDATLDAATLNTATLNTATLDDATPAILFLITVPMNATVGDIIIIITDPDGQPVAEHASSVTQRDFRRDDVYLSATLTSLRVDPDPIKDQQARDYLALLSTVNTNAVYLEGPFMRPVTGERRTSLYGDIRRYIYANGRTDMTIHNGIDYGYPTGTPVLAAGRGRVALAMDRIVTGQTIVLEHLPGVHTIYMHLSEMSVVAGSIVERGQEIGKIGATGLATGPHLHWELRIMGIPSDPEVLIGLDKSPRIRTMTAAIEGR
jgi:murein DD-endopeptidase MepM/ murein hydrolase activator NlpD